MRAGSALLCLLLLPVVLRSQSAPAPEGQPLFRAGVTYVEVDVKVTDGNGEFVCDLSRDDFTIFDDGVRQEVASFDLVDLPLPRGRWQARSSEDLFRTYTGAAVAPEGRVYALVLEARGTDHARRVRELSLHFLDRSLAPDDLMSVYLLRGGRPWVAQELTKSRPLLRAAIASVSGFPADARILPGALDPSFWGGTYHALEQVAAELAPVTGRRKAILWVGGSVNFHPASPAEALAYRDFVRAATRYNVAIYPIDPNGLSAGLNGRPIGGEGSAGFLNNRRSGAELTRLGALRAVAEDTGGIALVNTNNFPGGFERIVRDNSTYYLLGYHPTVDRQDGRFHPIDVQVNRPGVHVRARRGYYASERVPVLPPAAPVLLSPSETAVIALAAPDRRSPVHLRAGWVPGTGLRIVGEIEAQARAAHAGEASVTIDVQAPDGTTQVQDVVVGATEPMFDVQIPVDGAGAPGPYLVRVQVTLPGALPFRATLDVPVPGADGPIGDPILFRRGPTTGPRYLPAANPHFRRTEQLRVEVPSRRDEAASAQLLDRLGTPMPVPLPMVERLEEDTRWLVVDVPIGALAPAEYVLEVTQGDARRLAAFRIVP